MCESLSKYRIPFYPIGGEDGKPIEYLDDDLTRYTLKYETNDYVYIDHRYSVCNEMILPFAYYKASELIKDEGNGCRCIFRLHFKVNYQNSSLSNGYSDYETRYHPIRKELERFDLSMHDDNGDGLGEFFDAHDHYLRAYSRYCKIKLSIKCECYLGDVRDLNSDEEFMAGFSRLSDALDRLNHLHEDDEDEEDDEDDEPPKPIEESFRTDNCICLDKEPNILFTDCNHICMCLECAKIKSLDNCPYCRTEISKKIKI